jgi:hypothetical protein
MMALRCVCARHTATLCWARQDDHDRRDDRSLRAGCLEPQQTEPQQAAAFKFELQTSVCSQWAAAAGAARVTMNDIV